MRLRLHVHRATINRKRHGLIPIIHAATAQRGGEGKTAPPEESFQRGCGRAFALAFAVLTPYAPERIGVVGDGHRVSHDAEEQVCCGHTSLPPFFWRSIRTVLSHSPVCAASAPVKSRKAEVDKGEWDGRPTLFFLSASACPNDIHFPRAPQ